MNLYKETSLQRAFKFTDDDLRENRQGQLSPKQRSFLRRQAIQVSVIILSILAVLGMITIYSAQPTTNEISLFLMCLITPALITLAMTVGLTETAIGPGVVSKRTGQIHLSYGMEDFHPPLSSDQKVRGAPRFGISYGWASSYKMVIGDQLFHLSRDEYQTLAEGLYTVYFVPTINKIVSLELLDISVPATAADSPAIKPTSPVVNPDLDDTDGQDTIRG
jgi:hypothetical protein